MSTTGDKTQHGKRFSLLAWVPGMVLGAVLGCAAGFGAGLVGGIAVAETTQMSCFEGACSYFAVFLGLGGGLAGLFLGPLIAWRIMRGRPERVS